MCVRYGAGPHGPGGKPLEMPKEAGAPPPPDKVNNQEVAPQTNRKELSAKAKADYEAQEKPINWRERLPSKDDPQKVKMARLMGGMDPMATGNWGRGADGKPDYRKIQLKLNPDGTHAGGFGKDYYENPDNWWGAEDFGLEVPNSNEDINL